MSDMARTKAARPPSKTAAVLRVLGALLCLGGGGLMVGSEVFVLLQRTAVEHAQYADCVAAYPYRPIVPPLEIVSGPQRDLCLVPAMLVLLVIGVRVLLRKAPGIAPPAATLLVIGGVLAMFGLLSPIYLFFGHAPPPCPIVLAGSIELLFWIGLLAGLVGSIVLSRTTRYRPLRLEDE